MKDFLLGNRGGEDLLGGSGGSVLGVRGLHSEGAGPGDVVEAEGTIGQDVGDDAQQDKSCGWPLTGVAT